MITSTLLSLLLPALVSAHGYVNKVTIDGTVYQGNSVGTTSAISSVIRQVNTNSPVKGATNPDINCGSGAQLAANVANANPGSTVQVSWVGGTTGTSPWPHNTGPIMHYMAKCTGSCATYSSSGAQWFKISELGYESGSTNTWSQAQLQSGSPVTVTIPSTLAPGNYLLRSEVIALQLAMTQGGAEFYPACIQLSVGGSQTGQPTSSEEVAFPGGYSDTDPGILTPNIYNPGFTYTFPGPAVAAFVSGGSGAGSSNSSGSSAPAAPSPSTAPSSASSPAAASASSVPTAPTNVGGNAPSSATLSTPAVSASSMPSAPVNVGGYSPSSAASTPSPTGGSGSTCMRRKRSLPEVTVEGKRMHRRRYRTSH